MAKSSPWSLSVQKTERITPNMQRITFGGAGLDGFPEDTASAYLKLVFPIPDQESSAVRSYTVRNFDRQTGELEMDFVVHGDAGPASGWAERARIGDTLRAGGPGPRKLVNRSGDWFLILGDMSALPAIGANLAHMPSNAKGYAFIEILDAADRQELSAPSGVSVCWLVNPDAANSAAVMLDAVQTLAWLDGQCEAWVAGELDSVRAVRSFLKSERRLSREHLYASSYWQLGKSDEQHRVAKAADRESDGKPG